MVEKRLRKSKEKKVAGVCGGVAEYFGMDPTLVRLIWALSILFYGFGLGLYIIMAIIMPEAESTAKAPAGTTEDVDDIVVEVADVDDGSEEKK
jgi:phage shock protein PspC (stress-responsive transcriptional regulator)